MRSAIKWVEKLWRRIIFACGIRVICKLCRLQLREEEVSQARKRESVKKLPLRAETESSSCIVKSVGDANLVWLGLW